MINVQVEHNKKTRMSSLEARQIEQDKCERATSKNKYIDKTFPINLFYQGELKLVAKISEDYQSNKKLP